MSENFRGALLIVASMAAFVFNDSAVKLLGEGLPLFQMPLANLIAILQFWPLTIALGAALFLFETLGWRRLSAIIFGFVGMGLIVRPSAEEFGLY